MKERKNEKVIGSVRIMSKKESEMMIDQARKKNEEKSRRKERLIKKKCEKIKSKVKLTMFKNGQQKLEETKREMGQKKDIIIKEN